MTCTCDIRSCWKCLLFNCTNDDCKVHILEEKIIFKSREGRNGKQGFCKEVNRLKEVLKKKKRLKNLNDYLKGYRIGKLQK